MPTPQYPPGWQQKRASSCVYPAAGASIGTQGANACLVGTFRLFAGSCQLANRQHQQRTADVVTQ